MDVFIQPRLQRLNAFKSLQVEKLGFQRTKETFHCGIVQTVPFARHALFNPELGQFMAVLGVLVMPALVRVDDQLWLALQTLESLIQHIVDQRQAGPGGHFIRNDFAVI